MRAGPFTERDGMTLAPLRFLQRPMRIACAIRDDAGRGLCAGRLGWRVIGLSPAYRLKPKDDDYRWHASLGLDRGAIIDRTIEACGAV